MGMTNMVYLIGNLGAEPELRTTQSGTAVMNLRLASSERVKKGDAWEDHTEWHAVVVWGARAASLASMLAKGSKIGIVGKLRTSSYEKDGQKRYKTEIHADDIELLTPRGAQGDTSFGFGANQGAKPAPQQQRAPQPPRPADY